MMEKWKDIKGYEGLYEISNDGLLHIFPRKWTKERYTHGRKMDGYYYAALSIDGNTKTEGIHRIVYETFVGPIPEGCDIHHKNHIKTDNRIENLQLLTKEEHNKIHKEDRKNGRLKSKKGLKPVIQYTLEGEFLCEYESATEAERQTGISHSKISGCCNEKVRKHKDGHYYQCQSAGGYIWKFKN